jgi:hypothetical protein
MMGIGTVGVMNVKDLASLLAVACGFLLVLMAA